MKDHLQIQNLRDLFSIGKRTLKIAWQVRPKAVALHLFGGILESFSSILTIYASAKLAGLLAAYLTTRQTEGIWFWLYVDIASTLLSGLGFWLMKYSDRLLYFAINKWAVNTFMRVMGRIDINSFYDDDTRNQINKAQSGYSWQIPNITYMYLELIYGIVRFAAIGFVVSQIQPWLLLLIVVFLVPSLISDTRIANIQWLIWGSKGDERHIFTRLSYMFSQPKEQMELRSMQAQEYARNKVRAVNNSFLSQQEKDYRAANRISLSAKVFEVGGIAVGSIILLRQFLGGIIPLDRYFFLSGALLRINGAINAIFGTLSRIQEPLLFAKDFYQLMEMRPSIHDVPDPISLTDKKPPKVEFKSVSFSYPGQTEPVFQNLNLKIAAGEHVALVGENGAGKTTLIKLLLRFYKPDSGTILVNGHDLQTVSIDSWYRQLATLFQDFNHYPLPIDENIYIGDSHSKPDPKKLNEAAAFGGVNKLIKSYRYGWETVLDASFEKGVEPSGGQWQRVALSRAFYRNASLLILDEPTSAIDAKAEYDIFNDIFKVYKDRSVLIVSHRFSTVRRAHRIVVLEHGEIVEQGSHRKLMNNQGLYHDLFSKQAEGYKS